MSSFTLTEILGGTHEYPEGYRATVWENGGIQQLASLPGHGSSFTTGLNNHGQIIGTSDDGKFHWSAVLWTLRNGCRLGSAATVFGKPCGNPSRELRRIRPPLAGAWSAVSCSSGPQWNSRDPSGALAMQKVEGSGPLHPLDEAPRKRGVCLLVAFRARPQKSWLG